MLQTSIPQKRKGWKRWFVVLCWLLFLAYACFSALKLVTYPQVYSYRQGTCTITANLTTRIPGVGGRNARPTTFHPEYGYTLHTADGQIYQTRGYDWFTNSLDSYTVGSNVAGYHLGQTVPCWYNPQEPSQTVLTRDVNWGTLFFGSTNMAYRWAAIGLLLGAIFLCLRLSLLLLAPLTQALAPNYWRRKERALQSLTASPTSLTPTTADTIPPEVYALTTAYHLGRPVEEYVQSPQRTGFGCLLVLGIPLFSLVFIVLTTLGLALLLNTQKISLDPTPVWFAPLIGFLLIFSLVAGVLFFGLIMGPTFYKREQADILYRFSRAELFYTCTHGLLWLKQGKVTAAYPWYMVRDAGSDLDASGKPRASWVSFTNGSRYPLYPDAVLLVQRGLIHYRQAHP